MRAVLLGLLLLTACDKKKEAAGTPPAAPTPAAPSPTPPSPTPPSPTPAPPPAPTAPAPNIDCGALVTTGDVKAACGAGFEVKADDNPINKQYTACALVITAAGKQERLATITVQAKHDAIEAKNWVDASTAGSTAVTGLGDRAWSRTVDHPDRRSTDYDVGVQKGALVFMITATKNELTRSPCTIDQFVEVARKATPRLP